MKKNIHELECHENCGHSDAEHRAFDQGYASGFDDDDEECPFSGVLREAWLCGQSVGKIEGALPIEKPKWTPFELNEKMQRWSQLRHEVEAHDPECDCNRCLEWFGTGELLATFSEDEKAAAVNQSNQLIG